MARELPAGTAHLHVHYLHTPASVIRYAALLRGIGWSFSAHAKDIWTTPDWEKREKIAAAAWGVTCTQDGHRELQRLADRPDKIALVYHGLDLDRFPTPTDAKPARNGKRLGDPVRGKMAKVNLDEAKLDFELVGGGSAAPRRSERPERPERTGRGHRGKRRPKKK